MINYLLFLFVLFEYDSLFASGELRCIERERQALLRFKQGLIDEDDILSSWGSEEHKSECCKWKGITCNNETGHVTGLQISQKFPDAPLRGNISSALLELNYLNNLDLSYNDFTYNEIPEFIGSLQRLQHLNVSYCNFFGVVPHQLGNLTNLKTLDLGYNELVFKNLDWLYGLSLLSVLDLSRSDLRDTYSLQSISNLPSLTELYLSRCQIPTHFSVNSSSTTLSVLDLSHTRLTSSSFHWLLNISTNLRSIDLSGNYLGTIPDDFGRFTFLEYIDLSYNELSGGIPKSLGNLSRLQTLTLSKNELSEPISEIVCKLSAGTNESLEILKLDGNRLSGSLPEHFGHLSRLEHLDLSAYQVTGSVPDMEELNSLKKLDLSRNKLKALPRSLWQLSMLEVLDVSFNSFEGTISDADFSKLKNLKVLDLSYNPLVLNFTAEWIPPFQLQVIRLASYDIGPRFPTWLRTQTNFSELDLSRTGISDEVPKWLWDLSSRISYLNLSHNQLSGDIPDLSSTYVDFPLIDISYNNFSGHLPLFYPDSWVLQLSNNRFMGSIQSVCKIIHHSLVVLDLSNNQFSGKLPNCWSNMERLSFLNLANNKLSGPVPQSLGSLWSLHALYLYGNNLSGELPSTLKNFQDLVMIDIGGNELTGNIPTWIGTHLKALKFLSFGHNNFYGSIPFEICYLTEIQILDLSRNSLSGRIPQCFNNFTSLVQKNGTTEDNNSFFGFLADYISSAFNQFTDHALVQWKGQEQEYRKTLGLLKLIDLSNNKLVGSIPDEFSHMKELISLNLSRNYLSGNIITDIGHMEMLESLDLSGNQFFGEIPIGLAELHFLAVLDLSYNNLSGKIPSSSQLQGFDASVYAGNNELCGRPLKSCPEDSPNPSTTDNEKQENGDEEDDGFITREFIISMILGSILGFWGVVGTLALKSSWRNAYFIFFTKIIDWLYVTTTIYVARLKRTLTANARN